MHGKTLVLGPVLVVSALCIFGCDLKPQAVTQSPPSAGSTAAGATATSGGGSSAAGGGGSSAAGGGGGSSAAGGGGAATGGGGASTTGDAGGSSGAPAGGSMGLGGAANTPNNLVQNGDFSEGEALWHVDVFGGTATHAITNGQYCVSLTQNASCTVGWPLDVSMAFTVADGAAYHFSYQASVSGSPTSMSFSASVGPTGPGTGSFAGFSVTTDQVTSSPQTFEHSFVASGASSSAGIAFNIQAASAGSTPAVVCIDNVSVSTN